MDDLQFRRNLYADPKNIDADMQQAISDDAHKEKLAHELNLFDDKITTALNVDVPEGLSEKLILRQTMASHTQQKRKSRVHLALAASVAFGIGLTMNAFQFSSAYNNLGDHALAHIHHEEGLLSAPVNADLTLASVNQKMATFGGNFKGAVGEIVAADFCRFDGIKSLHLVFQGEHSAVTVFVVPHTDELAVSANFSDEEFNGKTIQYMQSNIVVIADKKENLDNWQGKINQNIQWSI